MTPSNSYLFPPHNHPRNWLITSGASPIGLATARAVLGHGDSVLLGLERGDSEKDQGTSRERAREFGTFMREEVDKDEGWRDKCKVVALDASNIGQCQAAVAEAVRFMGKIDVLFCCTSAAVIGTVEELAASPQTLTLVRSQFETNFFGPVNIIKATLPAMREKRSGHIIVLTGITSHLGTPGLGIYCSSGWALEGFCDSLAYEIAPFNIKTTILQPNLETNVLTNPITSAPLMPAYSSSTHPAPLSRSIIGSLLDHISPSSSPPRQQSLQSSCIESITPSLPAPMIPPLITETIHALCAIAGHENPPARHIVGHEAVGSVKEKLKTVSEELEDFVEVSGAVDIEEQEEEGVDADEEMRDRIGEAEGGGTGEGEGREKIGEEKREEEDTTKIGDEI